MELNALTAVSPIDGRYGRQRQCQSGFRGFGKLERHVFILYRELDGNVDAIGLGGMAVEVDACRILGGLIDDAELSGEHLRSDVRLMLVEPIRKARRQRLALEQDAELGVQLAGTRIAGLNYDTDGYLP